MFVNFLVCPTSQSHEGTNGTMIFKRRLKAGHKYAAFLKLNSTRTPFLTKKSHGPQFRVNSKTNYNRNACERVGSLRHPVGYSVPDWHLPRHHHHGETFWGEWRQCYQERGTPARGTPHQLTWGHEHPHPREVRHIPSQLLLLEAQGNSIRVFFLIRITL